MKLKRGIILTIFNFSVFSLTASYAAEETILNKDTIIIGGIREHNKISTEREWTIHPEQNCLTINNDENIVCDYHYDGFAPDIDNALPLVFQKLTNKTQLVCFERVKTPDRTDFEALYKWVSLLKSGGELTCKGEWKPLTYNGDSINGMYIMIDGEPRPDFDLNLKVIFPYVPFSHHYGVIDPLLEKLLSTPTINKNGSYEICLEEDKQYFKSSSLILTVFDIFQDLNLSNIKISVDKRFTNILGFTNIPEAAYSFRISGTKR